MANQSKTENRGGKRAGAGRKRGHLQGRETLSVRQLIEFERAARAKAKEHGMTLQEIVLDIAYDPEAPRRDRMAAAKLYWDKSIILASEGGEGDKVAGPAFYLPEQRPELNVVDIKKNE